MRRQATNPQGGQMGEGAGDPPTIQEQRRLAREVRARAACNRDDAWERGDAHGAALHETTRRLAAGLLALLGDADRSE